MCNFFHFQIAMEGSERLVACSKMRELPAAPGLFAPVARY
jgi:hypothetical protein